MLQTHDVHVTISFKRRTSYKAWAAAVRVLHTSYKAWAAAVRVLQTWLPRVATGGLARSCSLQQLQVFALTTAPHAQASRTAAL